MVSVVILSFVLFLVICAGLLYEFTTYVLPRRSFYPTSRVTYLSKEAYMNQLDYEFREMVDEIYASLGLVSDQPPLFKVTNDGVVNVRTGELLTTVDEIIEATRYLAA
jgi:hypothetical protein